MTRIWTFTAAAIFLAAAPLQAQQAGHTGHGNHGNHGAHQAQAGQEHAGHAGHEGMNCNHDDAAHRYAPKKLLGHAEMLQLTAQQKTQLEALQAKHHEDCQQRMEQRKAAEAAAEAALLQDTPDLAAFERNLRQASNLKVDCKVDMARTGQQAVALLTAAQRAHLSHMNHGGH
jgi:Spy/CpxP family protein refolding chaperone